VVEVRFLLIHIARGSMEHHCFPCVCSLMLTAVCTLITAVDAGSKPNILAAGAQLMKQVKGVTTSFLTVGARLFRAL